MIDNKKYKYTIYCLQEIEYIGSTRCTLNKRMYNHRSYCYNSKQSTYNIPMYKYVRKNKPNFKFGPEDVIILDQGMFTMEQARILEQYYIDQLNPSQNYDKAFATEEDIKEYHKAKDAVRAKTKIICPCGAETNLIHKSRHEKSKKHKDKIKEIEAQLNEYYKTSEDNHHCTLKHNEKFK